MKDLDVLIGCEESVLILDDSPRVWHKHRQNVLEIERYHFFPSSLKNFSLKGKSLLHRNADEDAHGGPLASVLSTLKEIHAEYFQQSEVEEIDVRNILDSKKKQVLTGCKIIFSCVIPKGEKFPERHPLWKLAVEFGAECKLSWDDQVTHVIAALEGTEKTAKARQEGKHVVRPDWLHASVYHFKRQEEQKYGMKK